MFRFLSALILVAAVACQDSRSNDSPDAPPFYRRAIARNFTRNDRPDSVIIVARGLRPDSLRIHLSIVVDGEEAYGADWSSAYELVDTDTTLRNSIRVDSLVRARLDRVITSINEEPLDTAAMRARGDTALLHSFGRQLPHQFVLSYGYRSTIVLIWDPRTKHFFPAYQCC